MDLTQRQQTVFKKIVEQFTCLAEPVGSKALIPLLDFPVSSATIRNDMAALERMGLLEKTHSSSGRIPSLKGYRYYIEHLMDFNLDEETERSLKQIFTQRHFSIDEIVEVSCSLLSEMTHMTSVAFGPRTDQRLAAIQLIPVDEHCALSILTTSQNESLSRIFSFEQSISLQDLSTFTQILNHHLQNVPLTEMADRLRGLRGLIASHVAAHEILFDAFISAFMEIVTGKRSVHGAFHILAQPEFSDREKVQELIQILEDSSLFQAWMLQKSNIALPIGSRNELIQIGECSVVTSRFRCSASGQGQLMVVGPSRMNYARIIPLMDSLSDIIEEVFADKGG